MADDRLATIEAGLRDLERRVRALEHDAPGIGPALPPTSIEIAAPLVQGDTLGELLALSGRTLVGLGGAFLLRAFTDSKTLPLPTGIALGFAYAAAWLALADRDGGRGRSLSATFHALVSCIVAFPLAWEATVRFAMFGPLASACALSLATAAIVGVALHRRIQPIAWLATAMALPAAVALMATGAVVPYAVFLVVFGLATLWIGYAWDWTWLRWPVALFADFAVFGLAQRAGVPASSRFDPALQVITVQMLLLNGYLGSIVVRTIVRARDVLVFEVVQSAAALAVGFGGAVFVAQAAGSGVAALAVVNLMFGVGCYGVAFVFVRHRPRNFYFYSTLGLVLLASSGRLLLDTSWLAVAFAAAAVACTLAAARVQQMTLIAHGAIYLCGAAVSSHLLSTSLLALAGPTGATWPRISAPALATLLAIATCWAWPTPDRGAWQPHEWTPRVAIAILLGVSTAGWLVSALGPLAAGLSDGAAAAGTIATVRTLAIALVAVGFGLAGSDARFRESLWLLYPLLTVGGVKLLVEDFPRSKPSTLFLALAVYGGALILAPRLSRRTIRNQQTLQT